ncbi:hypothetical protein [Kocuria sabuli]|uniref:hypothetical protein n=1 Tax=Kocuria sabuli TaxID=3071448 RepID=UPI0034D5C660
MSGRSANADVVNSGFLPGAVIGWLRPGSSIQAWRHDVLHYQGVVEETLLGSGVLWIREHSSGVRKMIDLQEYRLSFSRTQHGTPLTDGKPAQNPPRG